MNVSLVFPPFHLPSLYNLPPLGLVGLATVLGEAGHRAAVRDQVLALRRGILGMGPNLYDEAAREILADDPQLVGFSVQCTTFPATVAIARRLKELRPGVRIVAGGHHVSFVDRETLAHFPWIDAVIRGEGEETMRELVGRYAAGGDPAEIPGVTWRRSGKVVRNSDRELIADLDSLPFPDHSLVPPLEEYRRACGIPRAMAILEVGRGCPHRCVYCSESVMWRRRPRTYSVPRLVREMGELSGRFGAESLLLAYDQFTTDRRFVEEFCRQVIAAGLNRLPWYCISRLDSVDPPLLAIMREAGCETMCYGIDSGSRKTLAFIDKDIDCGILHRRVRETIEAGIVPTLSFVIGFPEEEREDIDETLLLALRAGVQGSCNPLLQLPTVLAGAGLHRRYAGNLVREVDTYFSLGIEFDQGRRLAEDERLIDAHPLLFSSFRNIPCAGMPLAELDRITRWFPLILSGYPKAFLLLSHALARSPSVLFAEFLAMLEGEGWQTDAPSAEADLLARFPYFAGMFPVGRGPSWSHLAEVVAYETLSLRVASRRPVEAETAERDLLRGWRPMLAEGVAVAGFARNIAQVVADLKEGIFRASYPPEPTALIYHHGEGRVEVTEVNPFGSDFLAQCDGASRCDDIAARLFGRYGAGTDGVRFREECLDALTVFAEMGILRDGGAHSSIRHPAGCRCGAAAA